MKPYLRQIILPEVGLIGQKAIASAKVLIVGAGGLGTPAAQYLAAAGVGVITLVDGDQVSETNLHRQVLYSANDLGKNKAEVLAFKLSNQYLNIKIHAINEFLTKQLALKLIENHDIVIDGTDNFSAKYLINDVCCLYKKPMVYGALSRFEAQLSVFWNKNGPCYRCIYPQSPSTVVENCAESGILGPVAGLIGCAQALEALKIILTQVNPNQTLRTAMGRLIFYNFYNNSQDFFTIQKRNCCFCQQDLLPNEIVEVDSPTCARRSLVLQLPENLIDVREQNEWDIYHLANCQHWPLSEIQTSMYVDCYDQNKEYYLICASGKRASLAQQLLNDRGYKNFKVFAGSVYEY